MEQTDGQTDGQTNSSRLYCAYSGRAGCDHSVSACNSTLIHTIYMACTLMVVMEH